MYGSVRKKLSVMADTTAVITAAVRPPSSATTIVKAMKTKARFDAEVSERSGISTKPSARPPSAPITIHTRLSLPGLMTPPRADRDACAGQVARRRGLLAAQRQVDLQDVD